MITKADINHIKSLDKKRERESNSLFVIEGDKIVTDILGGNLNVNRIFYTDDCLIKDIINKSDSKAESISKKEMERISHLKTPTTVLALVSIPKYDINEDDILQGLTLALDGVQDPGNIGTIIRIADWFGIKNVLCSADCADIYNPKVVQATMGAISRVKVHYTNIKDVLSYYKSKEVPIMGTFLDGDDITQKTLNSRGIIVMGNEGRGISSEVESLVNERLFIPSYVGQGQTSESLNVGVATAIICYAVRTVR